MRKLFFTINVCALTLLFAGCSGPKNSQKENANAVIEIPDATFKAYLLENFDKNKDGDISVEEAKAIKDLNISGMDIELLDGMEKFANLESLDCRNNQIETLELRYNKKLNKVICTGNKTPLTIYIGMTSPLRKSDVKKPESGGQPEMESMTNPIDETKVIYDHDKETIISLSFED